MDKEIKKKIAKNRFKILQNIICFEIEKIENSSAKFISKKWEKNPKKNEGGGEYRILKNGRIFEKVGKLFYNEDGNIEFSPDHSLNFNQDAFGLRSLQITKRNQARSESSISSMSAAAAIILLICITLLSLPFLFFLQYYLLLYDIHKHHKKLQDYHSSINPNDLYQSPKAKNDE